MLEVLRDFLQRWLGSMRPPAREHEAARRADAELLAQAAPERADQLAAYDENLLEYARTQWQFGDWQGLAAIERDALQHHPDRARLALLVAAAHLQQHQVDAARLFLRLAQDWGCNRKLIAQIMLAGVHNSLGRAAAVAGQHTRSLEHFEAAIKTGTPGGAAALLAQARGNQQYMQLGLPPPHAGFNGKAAQVVRAAAAAAMPPVRQLQVRRVGLHELGAGWAGNTVNTVIFRHHGVLTHHQQQYTAFYVDRHVLRIVRRDLQQDSIASFDLAGTYELSDAHNSISMGVDRAGHLHISYDHHGSRLRYRRSLAPGDICAWSEELPMTGVYEEKLTYPTFILPQDGSQLLMLYRDGRYNKGSARIKSYNEDGQSWDDASQAILSGAQQQPWTSNAYWNHPAVGSDGSLHLSFVWRMSALGEEEWINNANVGYACSPDHGASWHTSNRMPYKLPITQVNAEIVHAIPPGSNLINQCSMALDSQNRPHIVFYANDNDGIVQLQHLRHDGRCWLHQYISARDKAFQLQGGGTLRIPVSRPEIVLDRDDNAYVIYRSDLHGQKIIATCLPAADYLWRAEHSRILFDDEVGYAEPVIDRSRWQRDNILTLLLQHNQQPDNDLGHSDVMRPVFLLDIAFLFS